MLKQCLTFLMLLGMWTNTYAVTSVVKEKFDPTLDVQVFSAAYAKEKMNSFMGVSVVITNSGPPRELLVYLQGTVNYGKTIRLTRGEVRPVFFSLPALYHLHYSNRAVELIMVDTATSKRQMWTVSLDSNSYYGAKPKVAYIGSFKVPLNVGSSWHDMGRLDENLLKMNWKALAGLDLLMMQQSTFSTLPAGNKNVLRDWVLAGGHIYLFGPATSSEHQTLWGSAVALAVKDEPDQTRMGLGSVYYHRGLSAPRYRGNSNFDYNEARGFKNRTLFKAESPDNFNYFARDQLPDIGRVSATWVLVVLVAFAILAGPVGIIILIRRRGQPFKYLTSMMLISALFSGGILVTDALLSADNSQVATDSVVFIDQKNDRQVSLTQAAAYPLGSLAFELPHNTGLAMLPSGSRYNRERINVSIEDEANHQVIDGLLPTRQRRAFMTQQVAKASGRLLVTAVQGSNAITVENHLQRDLSELWVRHNGGVYKVGALAKGESREVGEPSKELPDVPYMGDLLASVNKVVNQYWNPKTQNGLGNRYMALAVGLSEDLQVLTNGTQNKQQGEHLIVGLLP